MNKSSSHLSDSKRLQTVLDTLNITAYKLAKKLGYKTPSSVYHVVEGRNQLSSDMIQGIIKNYPEVSFQFLKDGKGEALFSKSTDQSRIKSQQESFGFSSRENKGAIKFQDSPKEKKVDIEYYLNEILENSKQNYQMLKLIYENQIEIKNFIKNSQ